MTSDPHPETAADEGAPTRARLLIDRASWTLIDQGVISLGNFALNVLLARHLAAADYGTFALFLGAIFALRAIDYSLISYPLSVQVCEASGDEHAGLLGNTVLLAAALSVGLLALLVLGVGVLGAWDILLPAGLCYLCWQLQETMRRCLLANFRYRAAVPGDAASYVGQAVLIGVLACMDSLTLASALYLMSAAFVTGALVHAVKLQFARPDIANARVLSREYFSLGKWSLINCELDLLSVQLFAWTLAAVAGAAATAPFQAALNIAGLMNPIVFGIGNAIPQAAAQAYLSGGVAGAARVARGYILFGLPPILAICAGGLLAPELLLRLLYGGGSPYIVASLSVQLLVVAGGVGYIADMICGMLLGVQWGRLAFKVKVVGIAAAFFALPLIITLGVVGACLALAIANLVRVTGAMIAIAWLLTRESREHDHQAVIAAQRLPTI
jgi:O-antigen/teichoic acid export membrane protein